MLQSAKPVRADEPRFTEEQRFLDPASIGERFYDLKLSGTCLEPEFRDGELVVFDREAPVANGCYANFFYRPEVVKPGRLSIALKKLVIAPPPFVTLPWRDNPASEVVPVIIVEQFNPASRWSVRCADLLAVHRCLGRADDPAVRETLNAAGWSV